MKGAGMKKASELLDAIADAAREEAVQADVRVSQAAIEGGDIGRFHSIAEFGAASALLAVMRIMRAAAAKERAAENELEKREAGET
jgi:hypothetical protein